MLSFKSFLIGPPCVGKTSTLHRLTGEIDNLSPDEIIPSTGFDAPLTVQQCCVIGGKPEFYEILLLILHGHVLILIFLDMSRDLDFLYTVIYRYENTGSRPIEYESEFTTREIIQCTLRSISSLQSNTNYSKPTAILIGTHLDKCSEADVLVLEESVQIAFANFIKDGVLCPVSKQGEKRYIHPVNNVSGDFTDIEGLRELITTTVHKRFKPEPVSTATLQLHFILHMKFDPTPGWCSLEECIERCGISREDLLKEGAGIYSSISMTGLVLSFITVG